MTSAGSSIFGLTPPGSPDYNETRVHEDGRPITPGMGLTILPEVTPQFASLELDKKWKFLFTSHSNFSEYFSFG